MLRVERTVERATVARRRAALRTDAVATFLGGDPAALDPAERAQRIVRPWHRAATDLAGREATTTLSADDETTAALSGRRVSAIEADTGLGLMSEPGSLRPERLPDSCRPLSHDPCLTEAEETPATPPSPDGAADPEPPPVEPAPEPGEPAGQPAPPTPDQLAAQLASGLAGLLGRLADGVPAPGTQPTIEDVQAGIDALTLRTGPADAPAIFDFSRLHVALEHVWEDLYDTNAVAVAAALYDEFVEAGIDPSTVAEAVEAGSEWMWGDSGGVEPTPPDADVLVAQIFDITPSLWNALPLHYRAELRDLADSVQVQSAKMALVRAWARRLGAPEMPDDLAGVAAEIEKGQRLVRYAQSRLDGAAPDSSVYDRLHPLLAQLRAARQQPYAFRIYAAAPQGQRRGGRSVNFGIVTTYRQRWTPTAYQAGELVKTVPLAPKEARRFTKRTVVKTSRAEREVSAHQSARRHEVTETGRSESEIVSKALAKTNFALAAEGGVNLGIAHFTGSSSAGRDAATESAETKREFREAIVKAAEEYKAERSLHIEVSSSAEATDEESGEIVNPNDELTVTYLFYQLQRRYRVVEELHRVTPVVLVAQEFPNPAQIDEDWAVRHDWILRRVILDDSFVPALDYLATRVVGDESALAVLHQTLEQQRMITDRLGHQLHEARALTQQRYAGLEREVRRRAEAIESQQDGGIFADAGEFLFGDFGESPEAQQVREDAARNAFDRAAKEERDLVERLDRESAALAAATKTYADALSQHLNRRTQIGRLLVHLKDNIVHYMQAIWAHEPPDQRFLRLHDAQVPVLDGALEFSFEPDPDGLPQPPWWTTPMRVTAHCATPPTAGETVALSEVADIDSLLGFEGNYMVFPMRRGNTLTDFMTFPYLRAGGVRDPDPAGSWTLDEFLDYVCCLRDTLPTPDFNRRLPGLLKVYARIAARPNPNGEEIVVPTDSVFIEALPGAHPLLEDFKLVHRGIDARRAAAELRRSELENLRLAARLLAGELADPDVERQVLVHGDVGTDVET